MTYPEGEMKYLWEGNGSIGPSAECLITPKEIRLKLKTPFRQIWGAPELVLPREDIRHAERLFQGRYRFRSDKKLLDGACFRPIGRGQAFRAALDALGISVREVPTKDKFAYEWRVFRNSMGPRPLRRRPE